MWKTMLKTMDRKKSKRYKAFMNVGNQKMLLKEMRAKRNMEKKRDKQRYSPKNENDIKRWKWMWLKIFLNKLGGMGVRVRRG